MAPGTRAALNVVLFRPLIPMNTGNIGRTCLGFGARLHLIRPLGFDLGERQVKRAGLDHWEHVDLTVHEDWSAFAREIGPSLGHQRDDCWKEYVYLVSKRLKLGSTPIADASFPPATGPDAASIALVFGNEVEGLAGLSERERASLAAVYIPMEEAVIRSYNLSNAVAMAVYEANRQRTRHLNGLK